MLTSQRLFKDADRRKKSKERVKPYVPSPNHKFKTQKSSQYLIAQFLGDFNKAFPSNLNFKRCEEVDFLKTYEIMKKLGFIRVKENLSQAEINSDKAMFMDLWQELETCKQEVISRDLILMFTMAIEGFDAKEIK